MRGLPGLKAGISLAAARRLLAQAFRDAGLESPELDVRILLADALRIDQAKLAGASERPLEPREIEAISARATRRLSREPVSRIIGRKEFWSLDLHVDASVLVPRPETETIVEAALKMMASERRAPLRILDIGTGSGALLLALLSELPNASGVATDISVPALTIARANAARLGLAARCAFLACNVSAALGGPFNLIVSNPPYIASAEIETLAPEVRDHDPRAALDGGNDGLDFYRAIAADTPRLLSPGGILVVELGRGQERPVGALFSGAGLRVMEPAENDLAGLPRALSARAVA
ncbi:MAG TPA: peptide chain release factor N(5)-glutamine methyltransferase [Pseudolabrys sp.]|nr:peptide chain release factor N(5)-glutamine methyltransferase [Pseudolabrys sp.]